MASDWVDWDLRASSCEDVRESGEEKERTTTVVGELTVLASPSTGDASKSARPRSTPIRKAAIEVGSAGENDKR